MVYYILAIIALLSLASLLAIFRRQIIINRGKNLDYNELNQFAVTNLAIDYLAFKIVRFCQITLQKFYLFSIHFIKNSMATARYVIVRTEKYFNKIVDSAPEPEEIHKTDKVSFFLKEIKDHKDAAMAELQSNANEAQKEKIEK
ncbi:MAG: hypothetical protein WC640_03760 [Candidatus Paceibacterota bacterium]|jgi:hypothetical protein